MLSEVQPCLQLLRIGPGPQPSPGSSPSPSDLYTFLPRGQRCTFRLGRQADLTDLRLSSGRADQLISRVHAELQAHRSPAGEWTVYVLDRSTNGTFVNDVRIPKGQRTEMADGDTVTFGHPDAVNIPEGCVASQQDSEFYFLFQKVRVRPADFDAITLPKVQEQSGFRPVRSTDKCISPQGARIRSFTEAPAASRATLILNSIGSISTLKSQLPPFQSEWGGGDAGGIPGKFRRFSLDGRRPSDSAAAPAAVPGPTRPAAKHRRKTVHTVLPDIELEEEIQRFSVEVQQSATSRRHCKSESDVDPDLLRQLTLGVRALTPPGPKPTVKKHKQEHSAHILRSPTDNAHLTPTGKKRGRPRKHPLGSVPLGSKVTCQVFSRTLYSAEQCAAEQCQLPQEDTLEWVQCDDCDAWYHTECVGCNYTAMKESSAEFHCGCT
ncbi:transcription factor 19 [Amblyraja radiata]|uniref:transcription factor 19 n=1 Tax=Amblyraja radiata TaxID=386614 RepID=UPI001403B41E|nr:transcription factor 19 [Amblyraja radiata]